VSYTISYGSQSKILYDLREVADGEFRYNTDFSVDVVDSLGSDKSADITISPRESNVSSFNKTVDNRQDITHLKGLGGQAGPKQVTAEAVASSYSTGEKQKWRRYKNKEILGKSRLQDIIDILVEEYDGEPRYIDIEADVHNENLELGDTVKVEYSEENINGDFRVVAITEKWDKAPTTTVTLSNRNLTRGDRTTKRNDDVERFNRGYGGFVDRDQVNSGWNPAGDSVPQTLEIPSWPNDIVREDEVELTVQGRAWRSPVFGGGHSHSVDVYHPQHDHDVTHPSHDHDVTHPSHSHDVTHPSHDHDIGTSADVVVPENDPLAVSSSFSLSQTWSSGEYKTLDDSMSGGKYPMLIGLALAAQGGQNNSISRLIIRVEGDEIYDSFDIEPPSGSMWIDDIIPVWVYDSTVPTLQVAVYTSDGNPIDVQYTTTTYDVDAHDHGVSATSTTALGTNETSTTALGTTETSTTALGTTETSTTALGTTSTDTTDTATDLEAGIIDTFNSNQYYPSDVDIEVNGSAITTISGDSTTDWQTTIDLSGELTSGQNTITATPTSTRGSINLILYSELFRRGVTTT
jgi:hypothetical protein